MCSSAGTSPAFSAILRVMISNPFTFLNSSQFTFFKGTQNQNIKRCRQRGCRAYADYPSLVKDKRLLEMGPRPVSLAPWLGMLLRHKGRQPKARSHPAEDVQFCPNPSVGALHALVMIWQLYPKLENHGTLADSVALPSPWTLLQSMLFPSGVSVLLLIITRAPNVQFLLSLRSKGFLFWVLSPHPC